MEIQLEGLGLKGKINIPEPRRDVFIPFVPPIRMFDVDVMPPERHRGRKAKFEYSGEYTKGKKKLPIFKLVDID